MQIKVQFPADCYIRERVARDSDGNPIVNPETGEVVKKRGYYRGVVVTNTEAFREHYVDRNGNAVRQPENETIYYSLGAPEIKGYNKGVPIYGDMVLETWSSTDNNGVTKRGIKVVEGRNDDEVALEAASIVLEQFSNDKSGAAQEMYKQHVAALASNAFAKAIAAAKNRNASSSSASPQPLETQRRTSDQDENNIF
jgi:hypothetical protein